VITFGVFTLLGGGECKCIFETTIRFPLRKKRIFLPNPPLNQILPAISIKNEFLSWDAKVESPILSNINIEIPVGCLVVVGSTKEDDQNTIMQKLESCPEKEMENS